MTHVDMDIFSNNDRLYNLPKYRFFILNYLYLKLSENLDVHRKFEISKFFIKNNSLNLMFMGPCVIFIVE